MELVISKILYLFRIPKISVAYSATAVKTFFFVLFEIFVKTKKNIQISISLFCYNIDFQTPSIPGNGDECKTHLCFEFISHAILSILYPYSCKTHNISSKFGFVRFLM